MVKFTHQDAACIGVFPPVVFSGLASSPAVGGVRQLFVQASNHLSTLCPHKNAEKGDILRE